MVRVETVIGNQLVLSSSTHAGDLTRIGVEKTKDILERH